MMNQYFSFAFKSCWKRSNLNKENGEDNDHLSYHRSTGRYCNNENEIFNESINEKNGDVNVYSVNLEDKWIRIKGTTSVDFEFRKNSNAKSQTNIDRLYLVDHDSNSFRSKGSNEVPLSLVKIIPNSNSLTRCASLTECYSSKKKKCTFMESLRKSKWNGIKSFLTERRKLKFADCAISDNTSQSISAIKTLFVNNNNSSSSDDGFLWQKKSQQTHNKGIGLNPSRIVSQDHNYYQATSDGIPHELYYLDCQSSSYFSPHFLVPFQSNLSGPVAAPKRDPNFHSKRKKRTLSKTITYDSICQFNMKFPTKRQSMCLSFERDIFTDVVISRPSFNFYNYSSDFQVRTGDSDKSTIFNHLLHFMHDPEESFCFDQFKKDLYFRISFLMKTKKVNIHLPFPSMFPKLPNNAQSAVAFQHIHDALLLQKRNEIDLALAKIRFAAKFGVPLALYWLAVSMKYGWGQSTNFDGSFSCFIVAAYLSLLASFEEEQQPVHKLNESLTSAIGSISMSNIDSEKYHMKDRSPYGGHLLNHDGRKSYSTESLTSSYLKTSNIYHSNSDDQKIYNEVTSAPSFMSSSHLRVARDYCEKKIEDNVILWTKLVSSHKQEGSNAISLFSQFELGFILTEIGLCYQFGNGVRKDYALAAYFFEIAAGLGDADAAFQLGDMYRHGHGVPRDKRRAASYYRLAEKRGIHLVNCTWIYKSKWGGQIQSSKITCLKINN